MSERYLLYLDILGFESLTANDPNRVDALMDLIDRLPAHTNREAFKVIVFSDTVLVCNVEEPLSESDAIVYVMYLIEYALYLHERLVGSGLRFRAVIRRGEFTYRTLKNIDTFYGAALIQSYKDEKSIPCTGLFITPEVNSLNKYYATVPYSEQFEFVLLAREADLGALLGVGTNAISFPLSDGKLLLSDVDLDWGFESAVAYLEDIHTSMRIHPDPFVRVKLLATWDLYVRRFPELCSLLVLSDFHLNVVVRGVDWQSIRDRRLKELEDIGLLPS